MHCAAIAHGNRRISAPTNLSWRFLTDLTYLLASGGVWIVLCGFFFSRHRTLTTLTVFGILTTKNTQIYLLDLEHVLALRSTLPTFSLTHSLSTYLYTHYCLFLALSQLLKRHVFRSTRSIGRTPSRRRRHFKRKSQRRQHCPRR